jgi:hypothetical protein
LAAFFFGVKSAITVSMSKTSVIEETVVERIRQKLRKQNRDLRVATAEKQKELNLGRYYTIGPDGAVTDPDVDLELFARDINVLDPGEELKG